MSPLPLPAPPPNPPPPLPSPGTSLLPPPNPGTVSSSALEPTPPCAPPTVSAEFHHSPVLTTRARKRDGAELPKPGTASASSSSSGLAVSVVVWAHSGNHGAALGKDRLGLRRRGARAPRSGPCGRLTQKRARGRAGETSAPRCLSHAPGRASHEGGFAGARSAVYDAGEVAAPDNDGAVGYFGGVPAVGEKRPQWRAVPSELPKARMRCTGCHTKAGVNDASGLRHERVRQDTQQTSFLCSRRTTHSFIQISNTRTVRLRDALARRLPSEAN